MTVQPRPRAFAPPPPACNRTFCNGTNARVAVAGLLFTADALPGLLTMGASLDAVACAAHCYDKVAVHTLPALPAHMRAFLAAYGWTARRVPLLDPGPGVGALRDKHAKSFTKLQLWSLVEYERVVFLDADVLVVAEVDALFSCVLPFCVAPDPPLALGMNTGVLVLAPSHTTYTHLMSKYAAIATAPVRIPSSCPSVPPSCLRTRELSVYLWDPGAYPFFHRSARFTTRFLCLFRLFTGACSIVWCIIALN